MPSLLINNEKTKDPEKVSDVLSGFFLSIAENLNLHHVGKKDHLLFKRFIFLQIPGY
jgi:hypothetical protein